MVMVQFNFNENVGYHVLHELVIINAGEDNEDNIIRKSLPLYLRKLNCYAAAIFESVETNALNLKKVLPRTFTDTSEWTTIISLINETQTDAFKNKQIHEYLHSHSAYYIFDLQNYGCMLLCSNKQFDHFLKNELLDVINSLSKSLVLAKEIKFRKEIEKQLNNQNSKLKNFTYIVSHNIRSHSANISGLIQVLKDCDDDSERQYFTNLLEAGSKKLEETIRNLNEIISIHDNTEGVFVSKNLRNEVERTLDVLSNTIIQNQIKTNILIGEDIYVSAIPSYLDSIILNMLSNAVKYRSEKRPEITVKAETVNNQVKISFIDNGLGIDLVKYGEKLFGMYKTFHNHADSKGLGLFITKAQIEALGCQIEVESEPGKGTTFHVFLKSSFLVK
jgi:signal transduction histidine kinase